MDVELRYYRADESDHDGTWAAEWGWRDSPVGVEETNDDVTELIQTVVDDVTTWSRHPVELAWDVDGDEPSNGTIGDLAAATHVTLPTTTRP